MIQKIVVSVMSLLLVVGVVIGVIVVVKNNGHSLDHESSHLSTKMVTSVCEMTKYKEACVGSLQSTAKNSSATARDYILAVVGATLEEVKKSVDFVGQFNVKNETGPHNYVGLKRCKFFLEYAVDTLQASISLVGDSSLHNIEENGHELLSWMSAVYALEEYCRDPIDDINPDFKSAIENGTLNAFQLTHNAVNILAELSQLLKLFNVQQLSGSHRRLMSSSVDNDGYPTWFKASDRKMLAKQGGRGIRRPNVVVAKDGSGQFKTIGQGVEAYPQNHQGKFIIYVKAGVYDEQVIIDRNKPDIFIYGDGIDRTIVTGNKNSGKMGIGTEDTATFANEAIGFLAQGITFRNEAGPEGLQALAFRSTGDRSALFDCSFEAYQDTLFYQTFKQFYRNCRIYGTVDFIFGKGEALIQDSEIIVRKPLPYQFNAVTADGRGHYAGSNGLVIQNCKIVPDNNLFPVKSQVQTYLGRPWSFEARTVVMQSELQDFLHPEGWRVWDRKENHKTCDVYEYANHGPGAKTDTRNKAFPRFKVLDTTEAAKFTAGPFLDGLKWLPQTGIPYNLGL